MPDCIKTIKGRRSIRKFSKSHVELEKIDKILESATSAPSAGNTQEWRFAVVKRSDLKTKIANAANVQNFIAEAPVVIVILTNMEEIEKRYGKRGMEFYSFLDCGMAAQNLMLAATALGLGTCPIGGFDEVEIRKLLKVRENLKPVLIIPLGYPLEKPKKRPRKPLKEVVIER